MAEPDTTLRKSGIDLVGSVPWGTHFCMFYENKNDLMEILIPYFKAGLENNEFCMCVTSEPLTKEEAISAFSESIPGFENYLKKGQIEVIPYTEWYTAGGSFESGRVLQGWIDKLNRALASGYGGLRLTGNTFWLEKADWKKFTDYENKVNTVIGNYKMLAICTYALEKCSVSEIMDVVSNHGFSLIKRENKWESIESSTVRKAVDGARASEEKYRRIIETTNEGVLTTDAGMKIIFVNQRMADMLGYKREELIGRIPAEFLDKGQEELVEKIRGELRTGKEIQQEYKFRRRDGSELWVISSVTPALDAESGQVNIISMLTDITERKRAEEALAGQSRELQTIIDSVPASIFYKDTGNRFLKVNRAFCEVMGMPRDKLEGRSLFDVYPREQAEAFLKDDLEVIKSGMPKFGIIERVKIKTGSIWAQTDKIPYRDAAGNIIGIIGFAVDITARRNSEENLKKYNRTLRAISNANQALMHAENEQEFIDSVCGIIIKDCGYKLAWIGFAEDNPEKTVRLAAQAGYEEGYINKLKITWADTERGRGPTGTAIRTGKVVICRDMMTDPDFKPWREEAEKRGYASSISLPLDSGGRTFGALMIYSAEPDPFTEDEEKLLEELAFDLSYGITLIRVREKNREAEKEIKRIATFPEVNPNPITEISMDGALGYMNPAAKRLFPDMEQKGIKHPWYAGMEGVLDEFMKTGNSLVSREIEINGAYYVQSINRVPDSNDLRIYAFNITGRKKAEQALKKAHDELDTKVKERTAEIVLSNKKLSDEIREREKAEKLTAASNLILKLLSRVSSLKGYVAAVCEVVQTLAGSKCVGLKLVDGEGGLSYEAYSGFPARFLANRQSLGKTAECACMRVISGVPTADDTRLMTKVGSFCCEDVPGFLASLPEDRRKNFCRACLECGFESIAVTPIRYKDDITGVIQLAGGKKSEVNLRTVEFIEALTPLVGEGINKFMQDDRLRRSTELLERVFSSTNFLIAYLDKNLTFIRVNEEFARADSRNTAFFPGKKMFDIYPNRENEALFREVLETGEAYSIFSRPFEYPQNKIKTTMYWDWSIQPVKDEAGKTEGVIFVLVDVTRRKKAEDELIAAQRELLDSRHLADIGTLASTVAHELRNPLGVISVAAYNIRRKIQNPLLNRHLANIEKKVIEGSQIINNLLVYGRMKMPLFRRVNIYNILQECVENAKKSFGNSRVTIRFAMKAFRKDLIDADPVQLKEVFNNIINNACQALERKKGTVTVMASRKPKGYISVSVKDTGTGIDKENFENIFKPFYTTKSKGTGLGLAICRELIGLHGGGIHIESAKGRGSTFTVSLPARRKI
jgi:PAS domain S-box-containing protein